MSYSWVCKYTHLKNIHLTSTSFLHFFPLSVFWHIVNYLRRTSPVLSQAARFASRWTTSWRPCAPRAGPCGRTPCVRPSLDSRSSSGPAWPTHHAASWYSLRPRWCRCFYWSCVRRPSSLLLRPEVNGEHKTFRITFYIIIHYLIS